MGSYDVLAMTAASFEDRSAIDRVLGGDSEAYGDLVREHHAHVIGLCRSILGNSESAEDAAQEVFLKAYRGLKSFRGDAQFSTWIYRIAYRHCLDILKANKRRFTEPLEHAEHIAESGSVAGQSELKDLAERVMARLSPEYRLVLTLREVQGLSYEDISNATDSSLDSVKARLKRARQAMLEIVRHFEPSAAVQESENPQ